LAGGRTGAGRHEPMVPTRDDSLMGTRTRTTRRGEGMGGDSG
jgi:hypothetical protein